MVSVWLQSVYNEVHITRGAKKLHGSTLSATRGDFPETPHITLYAKFLRKASIWLWSSNNERHFMWRTEYIQGSIMASSCIYYTVYTFPLSILATYMPITYSKARPGFFFQFGPSTCQVILNSCMKCHTGLHTSRVLWIGPSRAKPTPPLPNCHARSELLCVLCAVLCTTHNTHAIMGHAAILLHNRWRRNLTECFNINVTLARLNCKLPDDGRRPKHVGAI